MKEYGLIKDIIPSLLKLDMDKPYIVEVKEPRSKRSLEQNRLLWELIHLIAKETHQDDMDVYCSCLEKADALSEYLAAPHDIAEELRKVFRGVRFIRKAEVNGKEMYVFKCYIGSSKMTVKEMTELIDVCIGICGDLGIPIIEYMYD